MNRLTKRIGHRIEKARLRPVRVFCFHQVSDVFEPDTMWECDWTQSDVFKRKILLLKKKYTFISLPEVTEHLKKDRFRMRRYAAFTADDGWASLKNIIPWLVEQKVPITLFLNPLYLDGVHHQERETEKLLNKLDIDEMIVYGSPYITIASHGWSHRDCMKMTIDEFVENVQNAEGAMFGMKRKIPYYAFTFGRHKGEQVAFLNSQSLVPVYMDGLANYSDPRCIHRELLDGDVLR